MDIALKHCMQGPKDKTYETKEWEFAVIDVSGKYMYTVHLCTPWKLSVVESIRSRL